MKRAEGRLRVPRGSMESGILRSAAFLRGHEPERRLQRLHSITVAGIGVLGGSFLPRYILISKRMIALITWKRDALCLTGLLDTSGPILRLLGGGSVATAPRLELRHVREFHRLISSWYQDGCVRVCTTGLKTPKRAGALRGTATCAQASWGGRGLPAA